MRCGNGGIGTDAESGADRTERGMRLDGVRRTRSRLESGRRPVYRTLRGGVGAVGTALRRWGWLLGTALLAVAAVVYGTGLEGLLDPAVPVFSDLGGHMVAIRELQDRVLDAGVHGWSYSWYGGFPLYYFYFPLPALIVVAAAPIMGLGPAATMAVVSGPLLIPVAAASLVRTLGGKREMAFLAGLGSACFILVRSLGISGGSLESALVGEFSYALGMALSLFYLASLPRLLDLRTRPRFIVSALLLAATASCHVLTAAVAVLGSLGLARERKDIAPLLATWGIAFLISGWWSIPFLGYSREMSSLTWAPVTPDQIASWLMEGAPLLLLVAVGLTWWRKRDLPPRMYRLGLLFLGAGLILLVVPKTPVYPARLLPYAFWAAHVLAATAVWQALRSVRRLEYPIRSVAVLLGLTAAVGVGILRAPPRWAGDVILRGDQRARDRASWRHLAVELRRLPPGAVLNAALFPEDESDEEHTGNALDGAGLLDLNRLTGHRTVRGLWQESSPSAPFATLAAGHLIERPTSRLTTLFQGRTLDRRLGFRQARLLGARYVVLAGSPDFLLDMQPPPGVSELARDSLWRLYEVRRAAVAVEPGPLLPVPAEELEGASWRWFDGGGESPLPVVMGEYGSGAAAERPRPVAGESGVELLPGEIRVEGATPGRPLLLRLSYFPNWTLASPGRGPFRAAPNHILVVPGADSVRLVWTPGWIERAGLLASLLGAAVLAVLVLPRPGRAERELG